MEQGRSNSSASCPAWQSKWKGSGNLIPEMFREKYCRTWGHGSRRWVGESETVRNTPRP